MRFERLPPIDDKKQPPRYTRRQIGIFGAGVAAAGIGGALLKGPIERAFTGENERGEGYEPSELFEREASGYKALYGELERDEILFINEEGMPIGKPVKLEPVDGISPGTINNDGFLTGEMNQEWIDRQREKLCAEFNVPCDLENSLPRQMNVIRQLRDAATENTDKDFDPDTYLDLVRHYAKKKVVGAEHKSRLEFVRERAADTLQVPATVKQELIRLLPGLAAQESHFNNDSHSSVGAKGIFQFMPDTWKGLGYAPQDILFLRKQVEAVGKYFSQAYDFIQVKAGEALAVVQAEYFQGSQEDFERDFLAPILLNSYNSGPARLVLVLQFFTKKYPTRADLEKSIGTRPNGFGKDVYQELTQTAKGNVSGYGRDSSQYVVRLSALADLLEGK